MRYKVKNVSQAPRGVEQAGGAFVWIDPGKVKTFEPASVADLRSNPAFVIEAEGEVPPVPADLAKKVAAPKRTTSRKRTTRRKKGGA
jgi:hypothetical protein